MFLSLWNLRYFYFLHIVGSSVMNTLYYPQINCTILEDNMTSLGSQEWFLTTACVSLYKNDIICGIDQHFGFLNGEISKRKRR